MFTRRICLVVALLVLAVPATAPAQQALDRAKALYLEAAYEDALALLESPEPTAAADAHLYRALCLIALGRNGEADAAIVRSIEADPTATAARQDVSPRVAAMLTDARRRILPDLARRRVADGRLAYQQGDRAGATQRFEAAVRLLDDPTLGTQGELNDLKTLASGFLDLIRAQTVTPAAPAAMPANTPANTAAASPSPGATPVATRASQPSASQPNASQPSASQPTAPAAAAAPAAAVNSNVTRPIVLTQTLPPWRPPAGSWNRLELKGSMLLTIDRAGRVSKAEMEQSIYPGYDRLLLEAARSWVYTPATRDGQPTEAQLIVPIVVRPQ